MYKNPLNCTLLKGARYGIWIISQILKNSNNVKKRDHILLKCRCYKRQKLHTFVHTYIQKENEDKANAVKVLTLGKYGHRVYRVFLVPLFFFLQLFYMFEWSPNKKKKLNVKKCEKHAKIKASKMVYSKYVLLQFPSKSDTHSCQLGHMYHHYIAPSHFFPG